MHLFTNDVTLIFQRRLNNILKGNVLRKRFPTEIWVFMKIRCSICKMHDKYTIVIGPLWSSSEAKVNLAFLFLSFQMNFLCFFVKIVRKSNISYKLKICFFFRLSNQISNFLHRFIVDFVFFATHFCAKVISETIRDMTIKLCTI